MKKLNKLAVLVFLLGCLASSLSAKSPVNVSAISAPVNLSNLSARSFLRSSAYPPPNGCAATAEYGGDGSLMPTIYDIYGSYTLPVVAADASTCYYGVDELGTGEYFWTTPRETTYGYSETFWCGWGGCWCSPGNYC